MKILIIQQYYLLPGAPGGSRWNEFARMWADAGHDVTVVAGSLDYATGQIPDRYQGRWMVEERDGRVRVFRCMVSSRYNASYAGRMWAFLCFTAAASHAVFVAGERDVVIATSPSLMAAIPGFIGAKIRTRSVPWVFEVRDLWPESAVTTGVLRANSLVTKALYQLEAWAYRACDTINVLTPAFRDDIVNRGLAPIEKIVFVPNGADIEMFRPGPRDNEVRQTRGWRDKTVILYAGAHGRANALQQFVDAADRLRGRHDIHMVCVGDGPERRALQDDTARRGLTNLEFMGPQPKARMPAIVQACDVGAAFLQRNETFRTVYPNKVFDYMATERPTILAIDGIARKLVCEDAGAGLFAEPEDADAIARTIVELADAPAMRAEMGRRGREWVIANATRDSLSERYLRIMQSLVRDSPVKTSGSRRATEVSQAAPGYRA